MSIKIEEKIDELAKKIQEHFEIIDRRLNRLEFNTMGNTVRTDALERELGEIVKKTL